jgi:hypothetical protein
MKPLSRFELYELVRDGTTVTGAQLALLYAIAWRAKSSESYSCYPSRERLVFETHYTEQMLRIAAKELEAAGYIKRQKRLHRSTIFYLNVALLQEMATRRRKLAAEQASPASQWDPFGLKANAQQADEDDTDGLEHDPDPDPDEATAIEGIPPECLDLDTLTYVVGLIWKNHRSLEHRELLMADLQECIRVAGSPQRCCDVIYYLQQNNKDICWKIAGARKLGRYLLKIMPEWVEHYADRLPPPEESEVSDEYTD